MASNDWFLHLKRDFNKQVRVWSGALTVDQACTSFIFASVLPAHHDASWLASRRVVYERSPRTRTRVARLSKVNLRWEECVAQASVLH